MKKFNLTKQDRAFLKESFNVSTSNLSLILSGRRKLSNKHIELLATARVLSNNNLNKQNGNTK